MFNAFQDLTGRVFNRLTVIGIAYKVKGRTFWNCKCSCGNDAISSGDHLRAGSKQSCNCLRRENSKYLQRNGKYRHGMSKERPHRIWSNMISRCKYKELPEYKDYAGRGITVCDSWLTFENFYNDMKPFPDDLTLDRIDNSKGYYKENCRWATSKQQTRNTRKNLYITIDGVTNCLSAWAEISGIKYSTLLRRIKAGWEPKFAMAAPVPSYPPKGKRKK